MEGEDTHNNFDVASFSYYLDFAEESSVLNSTGGLSESSSTVISPAETRRLNKFGSKNNEPEISIFGADKYLGSKSIDINPFNYVHEKESCVGQDQSVRNFMANTPKICSEASSWNSQPVLLKRPSRNFSKKKYKSGVGMRFYPGFCSKGPCLEKKAIYINGSADRGVRHGIHPSQPGSKIVDQFLFPILTSGIKNLKATRFRKEKIARQDSRNSIDVFGSEPTKVEDIALKLERKLSMLTWDAIPKTQNLAPTTLGSSALYDDTASYDSSDLFEIDNISRNAPYKASIRRDFAKGSAADVSSIVSDSVERNDSNSAERVSSYKTIKPIDSGTKGGPKSWPSWVFGCKSYKAARIAESNVMRKAKGEIKYPFT